MLHAVPEHDPFKKWWELAGPGGCNFRPWEDSTAVSHLSSQHYRPTLIQVWMSLGAVAVRCLVCFVWWVSCHRLQQTLVQVQAP